MTTTQHIELANAVLTVLQALPLIQSDGITPLPSTQIVLAKFLTDRVLPTQTGADGQPTAILPGIVVAFGGEIEEIDGNFEQDYLGYPVEVCQIFASNQALTVDPTPITWRKQIRVAFNKKTLLTLQNQFGAYDVIFEPKAIYDASLFREENLDVSSWLIKCWVSEPYVAA